MASIRERQAKGGERTWAVLYRHGNRQASRTFTSEKDAKGFRTLVESYGPDKAVKMLESDRQEHGGGITVAELAGQFLAWKARDVTERTMTDYRRDVDNWILPWLGHRAAETIDEGDVQKWVDHMRGRLSPKSVADRHMLLHSMYDFGRAKSRRLVTHNPCLETEMPRKVKKPPKGTTVPEFDRILEAAWARNPDAHDLILFLGETGWRWSEAAALAEVEDDGRDVWATVSQVFRIDGRSRQVLAPDSAKSYAAFRRTRMFPATAAMLRRRLIAHRPGDLVFTNSRGRPWNQNTFLRDTWPKILTDAGLWRGPGESPTPHWLRHMHVAVCSAAGTPAEELRRRLGHEKINTTYDVYGGMIGDIGDDALQRAAQIMAGQRTAPTIAPGNVVAGELA